SSWASTEDVKVSVAAVAARAAASENRCFVVVITVPSIASDCDRARECFVAIDVVASLADRNRGGAAGDHPASGARPGRIGLPAPQVSYADRQARRGLLPRRHGHACEALEFLPGALPRDASGLRRRFDEQEDHLVAVDRRGILHVDRDFEDGVLAGGLALAGHHQVRVRERRIAEAVTEG